MSITSLMLDEHFKPLVETLFKNAENSWIKSSRKSFSQFQHSTHHLQKTIEGLPIDDTSIFQFRCYLETVFKEF